MDKKILTRTSKFLSFVLRHKPEAVKLTLDANGWASIDELIAKTKHDLENPKLSRDLIIKVVKQSDKQRFSISEDGQLIRANQGHSVNVDLELQAIEPPSILYHGTATRFLDAILAEGLKAGSRQHVHLSEDIDTANAVGQRYGKPVILKINALAMFEQGHQFYVSENGVWLTENVPVQFIFQDQSL